MDVGKVEPYRDYLRLLARLQVDSMYAHRIDLSGVVQQTIWEAAKSPQTPTGNGELLAWLRRLLANNLRDEFRKMKADRRDVQRDRSLEAGLEESSVRLESWLKSQHSSPSHRAIRSEELSRLAVAISQLPEDQQQAIELHHLQGLQLQAVAEQLGRTKEAVAALLYRALKKLKTTLESDEEP